MEFSILPLVTIPTKTIKVDDRTHKRLKMMSVRTGEHVYEVVARLVRQSVTDMVDRSVTIQGTREAATATRRGSRKR